MDISTIWQFTMSLRMGEFSIDISCERLITVIDSKDHKRKFVSTFGMIWYHWWAYGIDGYGGATPERLVMVRPTCTWQSACSVGECW